MLFNRASNFAGIIALRVAACVGVAASTACASATEAPSPSTPVAQVTLAGDGLAAQRWDAAALARMPRTDVAADDHGKIGHWQGIALLELLRTAGAPLAGALRGRNLALYVRVRGADGYTVIFALAELDADIGAAQVILADHRDGAPLDAKEGPFRIIAPGDKRPTRWVRQVVAIDLLRAPRD